jgi:hypothetical protein
MDFFVRNHKSPATHLAWRRTFWFMVHKLSEYSPEIIVVLNQTRPIQNIQSNVSFCNSDENHDNEKNPSFSMINASNNKFIRVILSRFRI